jgi:hypothetical protein
MMPRCHDGTKATFQEPSPQRAYSGRMRRGYRDQVDVGHHLEELAGPCVVRIPLPGEALRTTLAGK